MNQTPLSSREGTAPFRNGEQVDFHLKSEHVLEASDYYYQENEEAKARREALGAAAFAKAPLEQEKRLAELAVEGIVRSGAWIEYVRKDYLDRHWNLHDRDAA